MRITFSQYVMHHHPNYWPIPEKFDPERWRDGFTPQSYTYMPFYVGARGCLAKHMAMMMMKLTLSVLARNFDMVQDFDKNKMPDFTHEFAVMRIINNVDVRVTPFTGPNSN